MASHLCIDSLDDLPNSEDDKRKFVIMTTPETVRGWEAETIVNFTTDFGLLFSGNMTALWFRTSTTLVDVQQTGDLKSYFDEGWIGSVQEAYLYKKDPSRLEPISLEQYKQLFDGCM